MRVLNYTGFPLRFGGADTEPIPAAGRAIVRGTPATPALPLVLEDGRTFAAHADSAPNDIDGMDFDNFGPDDVLIVPEVVAAAMRRLGITAGGAVFSPGLLSEEGGVRYATAPKAHPDLAKR